MRRLLTIAMLALVLLASNACAKTHLSNDYFPNPTEDSWEDARVAFNDNIAWARSHLKTYYPLNFVDRYDGIYDDDSYIHAQIWDRDVVWRHEFYNYHLTDDRDFLTTALGMYEFQLGWVEGGDCEDPEEGVPCYRYLDDAEDPYSGILFYMDGDSLFVDTLRTVNGIWRIRTIFSFYELFPSSIPNVMEMTILVSKVGAPGYETMSYTKLIRGESEESYQCVSCDPDDPEEGYLKYFRSEYNDLEERDFDDGTIGRFLEIAIGSDFMTGRIYDDDTGEYYRFRETETGLEPWTYERYVRNTNVVSYTEHSGFRVNLAEVPGWDNIRKVEDEIGTYRLYDGDVLLSGDERIRLEYRIGEYPYFEYVHFDDATWIPDDILGLGVIGLSSPYSRAYFDERFAAGAERYAQAFAVLGFDVAYEENYARFQDKLMTSVFPK